MFRAIWNLFRRPFRRRPALVAICYPMVPNALSAAVDIADPMRVLITLSLPADATDVWGVEIRDSDNSTVLYSYKDILLSIAEADDPALIWTWANSLGSPVRTKTLYAYSFNLLGERSSQFQIDISIPTPSLSGLAIDETAETLAWVGADATQYQVEIATDSGFTSIVFNTKQTDEFIALDEASLLLQRWFRVTPRDALGAGTPVTINHVVTPSAPTSLDATGTGAGAFQFKWATAASPVKPASLLYKVTIASDSGFTANVESFADIRALSLAVQRPNITRFWKVEAKYAGGSYGTAAVYGSPTAVNSGLVDLGGDVTGDLDDVPDGGIYGRTRGAVMTDGRVRFLRRSDAADIDTDNVFRKNVETTDNLLDGAIFLRPMIRDSQPITMNPDFEQGGAGVPGDVQSGWSNLDVFAGGTFAYDAVTVYAGSRSLKIHGIAAHYQSLANRAKFTVSPGDRVFARGVYRTSATTVKATFGIRFLDKNGASTGAHWIADASDSSGVWTLVSGSAVVPANTVYAEWELYYDSASSADGDCWFDALFTRKVANLDDEVVDGATYARTTPNQRDGGGRGYNALTASYNLATGRKVGGDSGILSERVPEVLVAVGGAGYVKSQRVSGSATGAQNTVEMTSAIVSTGTGWHALGSFTYIIGLDVASITFDVSSSDLNDADPSKNQIRETTGNNLGIDFAGAGTPTYQRAGNGAITVSAPPTGTVTITFYVKTKNGVSGDYVNGALSQKTLGAIVKGDQVA